MVKVHYIRFKYVYIYIYIYIYRERERERESNAPSTVSTVLFFHDFVTSIIS